MAKGFFKSAVSSVKAQPIRTTGCATCGLASGCLHPKMAPSGDMEKGIYAVAEAPGEQEDRTGTQLVGKVGQRFRKELKALGVDLDKDCRKTNAVICRPPDNRTPTPDEIASCRKFLFDDLSAAKPKVILLLGGAAIQSLLGGRWTHDSDLTVTRWRGLAIPDQQLGAWVCPTFHPSYVEREESYKPAVKVLWQKDLRQAIAMEEIPLPKAPEPEIRMLLKYSHVKEHLLMLWRKSKSKEMVKESYPFAGLEPGTQEWKEYWQANPKQQPAMIRYRKDPNHLSGERLIGKPFIIALDYETTGLKPYGSDHKIWSCSIATSPENVAAWPWRLMDNELLALWRSLMESTECLKIGANIKFEQVWTRARCGHSIEGWHWDIMLAARVKDNRPGNSSVAFQSYQRLGVLGFKDDTQPLLRAKDSNAINQIHKIPIRDLLRRNALDSAYEYAIALRQMEDF